ncbi:MAG TPA: lysylphosphatidylglycerol synthase transmembrane domain-containing protein [Thermoanaerobaculia bacterium]|nr:lysylphosphatidylglycerol synthase transmembrane domain-containing protein [Thermoanaerobaculia bacterium]
MNPAEPTLHESPLRVWGGRLVKGTIAVLTLYFTWRFLTHTDFEWSRLAERVEGARAPYLALGVGLLLARYLLWDWRFRLATRLAVGRDSGVVLGFFVLLASAALNLITPTARVLGGLMRARYFARANRRPFGFLYGVVLYDQIAHHAVMIVCTWITLIGAAFVLGRQGLGIAALAVLVVSAVLLGIWSHRQGPFEQSPIVRFLARRVERAQGRRLRTMLAHGHEAVGVFVKLLGVVPLRFQAAVLGTIYFLVNAAAQWALFAAIGAPVDPFVVLSVVALGTAAGTLSGAPGGLGATELAMMASFKMMGVEEVLAAAGTLLYRGLHYASVLAIGLPALALLEWRGGREESR